MDNIILVGCGQHANVVLYNLKEQGKYNVVGILDNNLEKIGKEIQGIPILGDYTKASITRIAKEYSVTRFFIGFGNMKYRKSVFEYFIREGWEAVNIIHPNAVVSPSA